MENNKYKTNDEVFFKYGNYKAIIIGEAWTPLKGVKMYQLRKENGLLITASEGAFKLVKDEDSKK